jgi:hypothetical protein
MDLKINLKFKEAIPPLSADEYQNLRESLLREGCRDAIIVWNGVIVDGYNRYEICKELDISFNSSEMNFESDAAVIEWILLNQLSRRNLTDVERGRVALKLKEGFAAKAKENQGARTDLLAGLPKSEPSNTRKNLARLAGLGERTLAKIEKVDNEAPEIIRNAMGGLLSVNKAAQITDILKQLPEEDRKTEAKRLILKASSERMAQINYEEKISKTLCDIIGTATINYEYLTEECARIYLKKSPSTVLQIADDIDYEVGLLSKLKDIFLSINCLAGTEMAE